MRSLLGPNLGRDRLGNLGGRDRLGPPGGFDRLPPPMSGPGRDRLGPSGGRDRLASSASVLGPGRDRLLAATGQHAFARPLLPSLPALPFGPLPFDPRSLPPSWVTGPAVQIDPHPSFDPVRPPPPPRPALARVVSITSHVRMFAAVNTDRVTAFAWIPSGAVVETGASVRGYGAVRAPWPPYPPRVYRMSGIFTYTIYRSPSSDGSAAAGFIDYQNLQALHPHDGEIV